MTIKHLGGIFGRNPTFNDVTIDGGIYFEDGQAGNYLDDYEEGTWTGTLIGDTAAPSSSVTATGTYTKIGRQVIVQISFDAKNTTGASGVMRVNGLPFVAGARGFGPTMKSNMGAQNLTSFVSSGQDSVTFSEMSNMTTFTIGAASSIYLRFALMYSV
jgi:hypothetical protein